MVTGLGGAAQQQGWLGTMPELGRRQGIERWIDDVQWRHDLWAVSDATERLGIGSPAMKLLTVRRADGGRAAPGGSSDLWAVGCNLNTHFLIICES